MATIVQNASDITAVATMNPTQPSAVRSIAGMFTSRRPRGPEDGAGHLRHRLAGDRVHVHREREHLEHGHVEQLTDAGLP